MAKRLALPRRAKWPTRPAGRRYIKALWVVPPLLIVGALIDPAFIRPFGPLTARPERITSEFTLCGPGRGPACVADGDSFKLGRRQIRITGIDAPELANPLCPAEAALARRSTDRLRSLLNQGPFDMIGHRLNRTDRFGRELMDVSRGGMSIGDRMIAEGLAHRYIAGKQSWCG